MIVIQGNKRLVTRQPVLRAAKILFGNAVLDCIVQDISASGARINVGAVVALPDEITIELNSGGMWLAAVRWQLGDHTGLQFKRFAGLHGAAAAEASHMYGRLRNSSVHYVLSELDTARHFGHPELTDTSLRLKHVLEELEEGLRVAAGRTRI